MSTIQLNRKVETIEIHDSDGEPVLAWDIKTDDKSLEAMLRKVGSSLDRFSAIQKQIDTAISEGEETKAKEAMARLIQRLTSAILGPKAWDEILTYIGDGEPVAPEDYLMDLGEIFAALATWLYERCSSKQLREASNMFERETPKRKGKKKGKAK